MTNLLGDTHLTKEQRGYLNTIQSSGEILRRVIDDVLDFSRIEAGKLTITPHAIDVVGAIQEVVALFDGRAHEKGIELGLDFGGLDELHVYADPARVKQVVGNLISNAVKFTDSGGVQVMAHLVRETKTAMVLRIEIIDTGIGIHSDQIDAIFEGFTQADNSMQRRFGGSGLGLTISKRLTELMGGHIGVASEVGLGSRFWVELPLSKISAATAKKAIDQANVSLEDVRVLLAEDNDINVEVAQRQIEMLGCSVQVAANGFEAVSMSGDSVFNLILMDIQMPEMDGLEATRLIRARELITGERIPIIALTATAFAEDKKACEDAGMDAFLSKPFKREDLERLLKQWAKGDALTQ
jgi:CheY-like chemotaxis protein